MAHFRSSNQILGHLINQNQNPNNYNRITNFLLFSAQGLRYRKIEVILTTSIDKLGKAGDVVKVAPGYFRNHLMPKMFAMPNINKFRFLVEEQPKLYQREEAEHVTEVSKAKSKEDKMKEYLTAALRLHNGRLGIKRLIKVDNELRAPVTKEEIVAEVARQFSICVQPENLHLQSPFTMVGQYEVPLRLPREIPRPEGLLQWTLKVNVRRKRSGNESSLVKKIEIESSVAKPSQTEESKSIQSENESSLESPFPDQTGEEPIAS